MYTQLVKQTRVQRFIQKAICTDDAEDYVASTKANESLKTASCQS